MAIWAKSLILPALVVNHVSSAVAVTTSYSGSNHVLMGPAITTSPPLRPRSQVPGRPVINSQTCGYTNGEWSSPVTCGQGLYCSYYTEPYSAPNFGCCTPGNGDIGCGYVSACTDYGSNNNPNDNEGVLLSGEDFYCGSDAPYCSTLILYGQEYTSGGTYSFKSYACQTSRGTTVTAFQSITESLQSSTTSSTITSSSSRLSPSPTTILSLSSTSVSAGASETSAPAAEEASSGLSQGGLIGIGAGVGLLAAATLAGALFWFWRRRNSSGRSNPGSYRQQHDETVEEYGVSSTVDQHSFYGGGIRKTGLGQPDSVELTSDPVRHELAGSHTHELGSQK